MQLPELFSKFWYRIRSHYTIKITSLNLTCLANFITLPMTTRRGQLDSLSLSHFPEPFLPFIFSIYWRNWGWNRQFLFVLCCFIRSLHTLPKQIRRNYYLFGRRRILPEAWFFVLTLILLAMLGSSFWLPPRNEKIGILLWLFLLNFGNWLINLLFLVA